MTDHNSPRADAEQRLWAIRAECKGNLWKTLRMTPETLRACRDLYLAARHDK